MMKLNALMLGGCLLLAATTWSADLPVPSPGPGPALPVSVAPAKDAISAESLKEQLAASEKAWRKLREDCKGCYEYEVRFSSWTGFSSCTTIVVRDNKVVERKFKQSSNRPPAPPKPPEPGKPATAPDDGSSSWVETTAELGKNKNGAPAKTIDQLYQETTELVGKGVNEHQRWLTQFDKNGVIQCFGCSDKRIMDDAPLIGARIDALRPAAKQ